MLKFSESALQSPIPASWRQFRTDRRTLSVTDGTRPEGTCGIHSADSRRSVRDPAFDLGAGEQGQMELDVDVPNDASHDAVSVTKAGP